MQALSAAVAPERLDSAGRLRSDLWLDQPDAEQRIAARLAAGEVTAEQARNLEHFVAQGYLVFSPRIPDAIFDEFDADVETLWREQPPYVAWAYQSLLTRFSGSDHDKRRPACRVADLHCESQAALFLYLLPEVHSYVELIFGAPAIATQSLFFEWGSQQALHRDPIHVQMRDPAHLLAAWIALEDIGPDCGPLMYVEGSHRLPYYQFEPGRFVFDHDKDGVDGIRRAEAWDRDHCAAAGLAARPFTCRRGDVLIWHHSLLHGGSFPRDPALTRKSFVVHFSTRADMREVKNTYLDPFDREAHGEPRRVVHATSRTVGRSGPLGFQSPLFARFLAEAPRIYALGADRLAQRVAEMEMSKFWKLRNAWFALKGALRGRRSR